MHYGFESPLWSRIGLSLDQQNEPWCFTVIGQRQRFMQSARVKFSIYHNSHYTQWQTNKNMAWIHLNLNTTPRRKTTRSQVCKILQPIQVSRRVLLFMDIIRELANRTEFVALFVMTYRLNIIILVNICARFIFVYFRLIILVQRVRIYHWENVSLLENKL